VAAALVSGALASKPFNGGNAWTRLTILLGLHRLGFDVFFVEQVDEPTEEQRAYFREVLDLFSLRGLLIEPTRPVPDEVLQAAGTADILVNIGGHLDVASLKERPRTKIFLDDDPGYTQIWYVSGVGRARLAGHDFYFTYGMNIGRSDCSIPSADIAWRPARPSVVLSEWQRKHQPFDRFTTVASWRGAYGPVEYAGRRYGVKAHEFRRFVELPTLVAARFEIALEIHSGDESDRARLERNGWKLVDPMRVAATPSSYRTYIQTSGAEFSAAQGIYVQTSSGWISDRSACYLAAGKPVLLQDTGFSSHLPVGKGLVSFSTLEEAAVLAAEIAAAYDDHCAAAREIAEEYFDSDAVLRQLLEDVL
jgi:hypothetical protein